MDPRLTPARAHVAAAALRGQVDADRFSEGYAAGVAAGVLDLKSSPRADAPLSTQLLRGETVTVYDEAEGWAFVQAERDGYVGYVLAADLGPPAATDHRVVVGRTFVYPAPDMKCPVLIALPMDARIAVADVAGRFVRLAGGGFVWADHVAPIPRTRDFVATAEMLLGAPYLWGGRSAAGIDCSGLVQLAASLAGVALPRDTDMQIASAALRDIGPGEPRRRGDLVFWPGHVGIMSDSATLVHANGHHMLVAREPFTLAEERIGATSAPRCGTKRHPLLSSTVQQPLTVRE